MASFFGFELKWKPQPIESVVSPPSDDGSINISSSSYLYYGRVLDIESTIKTENELIRKYREIAQYADCDGAIEDIVNEAIIAESDKEVINLNLDELKQSESTKTKIRECFGEILTILKFDFRGHDIFRNWYVDGRLYYQIILDNEHPADGIVELRFIDPRKIKKIKDIKRVKGPDGVEIVVNVQEYYLYNDKGITETTTQGVHLSPDSIIFVPSGVVDANTGMILGYLHKAVKIVNQLKMVEDALVIYRLSRAPERRIFYIDVGNMPKLKAEQYVKEIMARYRNKLLYDATTGEVKDDRKHLSMLEDFWMPRREGGKGTEITTLKGGENLGNMEDVEYFQNKLYQALNVPLSRLKPETGFSLGKSTEISRDEVKFNKFILRLRKKFSVLFDQALRIQLVAKNIIRAEEWDEIRDHIRYDFQEDNLFATLKENEIITQRMTLLTMIDPTGPYVGNYFSKEWINKHVLGLTDEEAEDMKKQMNKELKEGEITQNMGTQEVPENEPESLGTMSASGKDPNELGNPESPGAQSLGKAAAPKEKVPAGKPKPKAKGK